MPHKLYKILLILGIVVVLVAIPAFWLTWEAASDLEVDFLDVGQGDAALIKTPYGQNILIDGGPDNTVIKILGEVLPWWDRKIDLMILTHPHSDHVSGLIDVIKRYKVKKILYTGVLHTSPDYIAWLELVKARKIPLIIIDRPQTINLGQDCELSIIYPRKNLAGQTMDNLNNSSIVFKLKYGRTKFLFMGDAEIEVEKKLLKSGADLQADVLKVAHHGSNDSSGQEFLERVMPEFAIISVGADNEFGHPSRRPIKRLERLGARVLRTDLDGTIKLTSNGEKVRIK
jgi:competence protein ComEC